MSEGTGIGLYVLVGAVIFGVFVLIAVLFGNQIRDFVNKSFGSSTKKVNEKLGNALDQM